MNELQQSAQTCPDCINVELLVDDSEAPELLRFKCPVCEDEFLGFEDHTQNGWAQILTRRAQSLKLSLPDSISGQSS